MTTGIKMIEGRNVLVQIAISLTWKRIFELQEGIKSLSFQVASSL